MTENFKNVTLKPQTEKIRTMSTPTKKSSVGCQQCLWAMPLYLPRYYQPEFHSQSLQHQFHVHPYWFTFLFHLDVTPREYFVDNGIKHVFITDRLYNEKIFISLTRTIRLTKINIMMHKLDLETKTQFKYFQSATITSRIYHTSSLRIPIYMHKYSSTNLNPNVLW